MFSFSSQGWSSYFVSRAEHAIDVLGMSNRAGGNVIAFWIMTGVMGTMD
jgi:hypothetical protein